jgi:hypothetical protein
LLPKPQPEHAKLVDAFKAVSGGDYKQFIITGGIAYAYKSRTVPWEMPFGRVILNQDSYFITEITGVWGQQGFGAIDGWLNAHFPRR